MFIKKLIITKSDKIIREMDFHYGLNLIVDETPDTFEQTTGNNVGKTTVLKLIDFCLGAKPSIIYTDTENKKAVYDLVKDYLINNEISITLILSESLEEENAREIIVERNFLSRKKAVRKINGKEVLDKDFEGELQRLIFPNHKADKPTFRQIISHNIRYNDENINNTLKTLNRYTSDVEYESLYLFLLGCTFEDGAKKQSVLTKIKQEETYRDRLEKKQTKTAYEMALSMIEDDIQLLKEKKSNLNLNENYENDLEQLNQIKYRLNKSSSLISKMNIRKNLIEEAKKEMEHNASAIDLKQLKTLYTEAAKNVSGIQKTFEDLVAYHNNMLVEKTKFITAQLPTLEEKIKVEERVIADLLKEEKVLSEKIAKGDSFEELEKIISALNDKYRIKGEYESIITQLEEVESNIEDLNKEIKAIDDFLFSNDFEEVLKVQIKKFNKYFSAISSELYGEKYALTYDKVINKNNQLVYKFSSFNANMSSGKKQGEILCFDLAYILFADEEKIPALHFLLNDKKELMHDNQLNKVADFVSKKNIQLVVSILKDKLPEGLVNRGNIVVELSQESKLFKIEEDM
ncbi:DUF2326 domain-containing protein [Alkalibacterium pelagium]|uniref:Uncharacterized protein YydD, contains DUF2326 domain n=1 Tax=Alkalibacterium pelagium TaxID=426702 RepID=A0A1H7F932_9LACT|nr:DUF2326 domain-containing protein [Alkalibacterium pelagium]GEN49431.1 hypothetical protein APE02nite_00960 [Alkalibacterium pelagium]SEK22616.1 Uncharacterized protein YydD, contains DUF2326 domain [Alkalibacterium pelagium]